MPEEELCPVCKTRVPAGEEEPTACSSCDAKLVRGDDGGWVLAGDAPAG
jgi:hypothetical protein